jgi:arylsulfatase A-like enzyme
VRVSLLLVLLCGCSPQPARNVVLISLDTVRRDHLPTYGYERETAPKLAAFARDALVFWSAFAQDVNTAPSHASMFTALYPIAHGAVVNGVSLDSKLPTLAEILRSAGFRTAAFVSGYTLRGSFSGLDKGFDVYDDAFPSLRRDGRLTTDLALDWLDERQPDERFFLFLHLYDAHGPYRPSGPYASLFRDVEPGPALPRIPPYQQLRDDAGNVLTRLDEYVDRYDALIRYLDDLVAETLARLALDETVVVILADHGETVGERFHALDHGEQHYDEQIRIPLILRAPGYGAGRIDATIETVDLLPTLLELLAVPVPDGTKLDGASQIPFVRRQEADQRLVFSTGTARADRFADRAYKLDPKRRIQAVRSQRWKLIRYPGTKGDPLELYDLAQDPGEKRNVGEEFPSVRDAHLEELERWQANSQETVSEPAEIPSDVRENLRALGYADD